MKLFKDGATKDVSNEKNIALLLEMGWIKEELDGDLDSLKAEAKELGIKFQVNIGAVKLQQKIDEAKLASLSE